MTAHKVKGGVAMSSSREMESLWRYIAGSVDRIVACLDGLAEDDLDWRPLENANSLLVLATHAIGNVEGNILGVLCGHPVDRRREEEFRAKGADSVALQRRWRDLKGRIESCLAELGPEDLEREFEHGR